MPKRGNQKPWSPNMRAVLKRRVASLLSRGFAEHEIVQSLSAETVPGPDGVPRPNSNLTLNPKTGRPYDQTTISRIKRELIAEWQRKDGEAVAEHYALLIGENYAARRAAWASGDMGEVRALLDQMAKWIGANAPIQFEDVSGDIERIQELIRELAGDEVACGDPGDTAGAGASGDAQAPAQPGDPQ